MTESNVCVKKMKTEISSQDGTGTFLQPVLADEYLAPVKLVDMYISQVKNKKHTSAILKLLSSVYPLDKYPFLKRVRSQPGGDLQIIICPADETPLDQVLATILCFRDSLGPMCPAKVPATPALTREQFQDSLQYWPVNFHEDKVITRMLNGSFFDKTTVEAMQNHMAEAVRLAEKAFEGNQLPIGALIVDPASNRVVAKSPDLRQGNHPLQHATMVCIDMVARSQGGGMWSYEGDRQMSLTDELFSASPGHSTGGSARSCPYLCTGYHLYVTQEPCIMCAMALVHSRIEHVYYGSSHSEGALGSKYKLHVQQGLNHHYRVFKGLLKEKCDQLYASS